MIGGVLHSTRRGEEPWQREQPATRVTAVCAFENERRALAAIATRILGSARDAEDVLQDAYLRWQAVDHALIRNPAAFLTRMVMRLSLNAIKAAHRRRVDLVGLVTPEPEESPSYSRPADQLALQELADDLLRGFRLVMDRLTPVERAVFLLHECFGYSYAEIAPIVQRTEENCRQIERRARLRLAEAAGDPHISAADERLFQMFISAARDGALAELEQVLAREAAVFSLQKQLSRRSPPKQRSRPAQI